MSLKNFKEYNVEENLSNSDTLQLETYSAAFSSVVNDSDYKEKMLKLHNAKGQGNYGRCWAASAATNAWHAVTLVGYRSFKVNQYVAIWDSASNGNNGATKVIYYSGTNTTFQSSASGPIFTRKYSLSQY